MAIISGFKGIRYNPLKIDSYDSVLAPPYDVISTEERDILYEKSPYNVIRLILNREEGEEKYRSAADTFRKWIEQGILISDNEPSIYPYFQTFTDKGQKYTRKGFIALVKLEDFSNNVVLPHEKTFSKPKEDRLKLISASNANFSPVFAVYSDPDSEIINQIEQILPDKPLFESTDKDGVINYFWQLSSKDILNIITEKFNSKKLLIADGHHRYETALNYRDKKRNSGNSNKTGNEPYEYVMIYLSSAEQDGLIVKPTHRLIGGLNNEQINELTFLVDKEFNVENLSLDMENIHVDSRQFGIVPPKMDTFIKIKSAKTPNEDGELAVITLHERLLDILFRHANIDIKYTKSLDEVFQSIKNRSYQFGFVLPEIDAVDILRIAEENRKLPQKTTYFYPKVLSGLVFNRLD